MRGSPLFRSLCAVIVLLLVAIPIGRLTRDRAAASANLPAAAGPGARPGDVATVELRIEFTLSPSMVRLSHVQDELWAVANPPPMLERTLQIPWTADGVDLRLQIGWPEGAPLAAARVSLITPDGAEHQRSVWGSGPTDEVLTFP